MSEALQSLIERATEADRALDAAIHVALVKPEQFADDLRYYRLPTPSMDHMEMCAPGTYWLKQRSGQSLHTAPAYTASIDAALSLVSRVLPGAGWRVEQNSRDGAAFAILWRDVDVFEQFISDPCSTPALALCLALLRAVSTVQAKNEATEDTRG